MKKLLVLTLLINLMIISAPSFAQDSPALSSPKKNTSNIEELKTQGLTYYKWGKYTQALSCFEKIDKNSLNSEILLLMANCYDSLKNPNKASEILIKTIESNPENSFPYYNLGVLLYNNNNIEEATNNFKKAVKYNQNFAAAYYNLGVCYYSAQDYKKAKDCFINATKLAPDNENICYNLVLTFNELKNKKMAEKYLDIYSKMPSKSKDTNAVESIKNNTKSEQSASVPKDEKPVSAKKQDSFWQNLKFSRKR